MAKANTDCPFLIIPNLRRRSGKDKNGARENARERGAQKDFTIFVPTFCAAPSKEREGNKKLRNKAR